MATLLDIDFGDRRLENFGSVARPDLSTGHLRDSYRIAIPNPTHERAAMADAVKSNARAVSGALLDVAGVIDRIDEREAHYAVAKAENFMQNGLDGVDTVNEKGETVHTPGIFEMTPDELHNAGTDVIKETEKLRKSVRDQDFYKSLSFSQRKKFDRVFAFKEDAYNRAAANKHGQNVIARKIEIDKSTMAFKNAQFDKAVGSDDATYMAALIDTSATAFKISQGTQIENPEIFDAPGFNPFTDEGFDQIKWRGGKLSDADKARKLDELQQIAVGYTKRRVDTFLNLAANGEAIATNPNLDTPEKLLEYAKLQTKAMNEDKNQALGDAEYADYKSKIADAKEKFHRLQTAKQSRNAAALDASIDELSWQVGALDPSDEASLVQFANSAFDDEANAAALDERVKRGEISRDHAIKLKTRYEKLHADVKNFVDVVQHPENHFPSSSDGPTFVALGKMLTDSERNQTRVGEIEAAIEMARFNRKLSRENYMSLWKDARKKRDEADDRLLNQVFSEFARIDEDTAALALNRSKRSTPSGEKAVKSLIGELEDRTDETYSVADVNAVVDAARRFVKENPDKPEALREFLDKTMKPLSDYARQLTLKERVNILFARQASEERVKTWSIDSIANERTASAEADDAKKRPDPPKRNKNAVPSVGMPGVGIGMSGAGI